jgi:hypothetical protein
MAGNLRDFGRAWAYLARVAESEGHRTTALTV